MSTALTTKALLDKCRQVILSDLTSEALDVVIQDAIATASREIGNLGGPLPMAWNREVYDEIFTRYYASISDITQANPGVITADSTDPDLTSDSGYQTNDIVYIAGINGMDKLNLRFFRATRASDMTITLLTLDGQTAIDTSGYEAYESGGTIYHAGIVLPRTTIESGGGAYDDWFIQRVWNLTFDGYPSNPISEERAIADRWIEAGGRPQKWRYEKYTYSNFIASSIDHVILWYGLPGQTYNVKVFIEKSYPDVTAFDDSTYPPHPIEIHDCIWHRALSNLATQSEKAKRKSIGKEGTQIDNTKMEIVSAQYWIAKAASDENQIMAFNRSMLGHIPNVSDGMSA